MRALRNRRHRRKKVFPAVLIVRAARMRKASALKHLGVAHGVEA
jgi:hypothetical protein